MKKLILILFTLLPHILFAQSAIIQGEVISVNKKPIPNVNININGKDTTYLTDSLGRFSIQVEYPARVKLKKYCYKPVEMNLPNDSINSLKLDLDTAFNCFFDKLNCSVKAISKKYLLFSVCEEAYLVKNFNNNYPIYIVNGQEILWEEWLKLPKNISSENMYLLKDKDSDPLDLSSPTLIMLIDIQK